MKATKLKNHTIIHETLNDAIREDHHFMKEEVRQRVEKVAHDLYMKRGCVPGYDLTDWFEAQRIVKEEMAREVKENRGK